LKKFHHSNISENTHVRSLKPPKIEVIGSQVEESEKYEFF